ncbi:MAG: hypothetical protein NZ555_06675 [Geminicoccaceae bacterium]|nr:hypothetical protein [Geminicoccaceae bacterium]MCX8100394.1 hypothetical protein [Geminicoccaceae bacterium]MDW8369484.1 hypothetical protein [Geminicoccaceae bacterium]
MARGAAPSYPLAALVREAWLRSFADRAAIARAAGLWVVASLVADVLAASLAPGQHGEPVDPASAVRGLLGLPLLLVGWLGLSAVTVWRIRSLLQGAPQPVLMAPIDRHVVRYVLAEILVGLLAALPFLMALALLAPIGGVPLALVVGIAAALFLFARLHLVLVAAALGEAGLGFDRSWRATAGVWPVAALAAILCTAPLGLLAGQIGSWIAETGALFVGAAVATAGAYAQASVLATFLAASRLRLLGPQASAQV